MREFEGAPFRPGGSVMISSREPDVQCFVQDHAPAGWWTEIKDLYQKALDFEMNGLASLRARGRAQGLEQSMRRDSGHVMSSTQKHPGYVGNVGGCKRGHDGSGANAKGKKPWRAGHAPWQDGAGPSNGGSGGNGGSAVYIPPDEMRAQYLTGLCQFCGTGGHQRNSCTKPKSVFLSFANRGQSGNN